MLRYTFLILLVIHVLCDFYFRTETVESKMKIELRQALYHACIYGVFSVLLFILFLPGLEWRYILFFVLSHGLIDVITYFFHFQSTFWQNERNIFLLDQAMHFMIVSMLVYYTRTLDLRNLCREEVCQFLDVFGVPECILLAWMARLLLIHKPANILIVHILSVYKPTEKDGEAQKGNDKNAGRFIGTLERIIMVIFIALEQYSAVGLVLTAKSIARYERITKEQDFAEYYLLGTLLSTIVAICVSVLI